MEAEEAMRKFMASLSREEQKAYRSVKMAKRRHTDKKQEKKHGDTGNRN